MISFFRRWIRAGLSIGAFRQLMRLEPRPKAGRGLPLRQPKIAFVFVPGWYSNSGAGRLLFEDLDAVFDGAVFFESATTLEPRPHDQKVERVLATVDEAAETGAERLVLIGHSYGGILATAAALRSAHCGPSSRVVTLNTPFHGPRRGLVAMGRILSRFRTGSPEDPELAFMRSAEGQLESLRERLATRSFELHTVMTKEDEFVTHASGVIEDCELSVPGLTGHTNLLTSKRERSALVEALQRVLTVPSR